MIELVSVEVVNFRSFSNGVFTPLGVGQGMTAINGANGSGKSSIVAAVLWALYGITPDGVPVRALRRQGSEGEVRATVVFRHAGETVRVTRALRGRNDSTVAAVDVDGVEQTAVSSRTATAWVVSRLGLDAEAFLTAFVVRQKELDSLVRARPAERRKTIERLAGIERMSSALDLARGEARAAQRLLDALPPAQDPEVSFARLGEAEVKLGQVVVEAEAAETEAQETASDAAEADRALTLGREAAAYLTKAQHDFEIEKAKLDRAVADVERLSSVVADAEDLPHAQSNAERTREARSEAEQALKAVASVVDRAESDADRASHAEREAARLAEVLAAARTALTECEHALASFPHDLDALAKQSASIVQEVTDRRGSARGEWERLRKAINTLREAHVADSAASCPTCAQSLEDPASLIATLHNAQALVEQQGKEMEKELEAATVEAEKWSAQVSNRAAYRERLQAALVAESQASVAAEQAEEEAARAVEAAETTAEAAHEATLAAREAEKDLPALREAEATAQAALRKAENAVQALSDLETAAAGKAEAEVSLQSAHDVLREAEEACVGVDVAVLEVKARETAVKAQGASRVASELRTAHALAVKDVDTAREAYEQAVAAAAARQQALVDAEKTAAVASALEEFRRDRLARLAPELSEVASDFVARMTDGRYTAVELDEEFTPVLTEASGAQRPVSWLSGGEESAVALALRIAIGEVLAGNRGGLLVLDEVLTAQDRSRRQATMGAIRALPRQIITINHVSEATDMVDLVTDVVDDGEGASTLVDSVPADALGADFSAVDSDDS